MCFCCLFFITPPKETPNKLAVRTPSPWLYHFSVIRTSGSRERAAKYSSFWTCQVSSFCLEQILKRHFSFYKGILLHLAVKSRRPRDSQRDSWKIKFCYWSSATGKRGTKGAFLSQPHSARGRPSRASGELGCGQRMMCEGKGSVLLRMPRHLFSSPQSWALLLWLLVWSTWPLAKEASERTCAREEEKGGLPLWAQERVCHSLCPPLRTLTFYSPFGGPGAGEAIP